MTGHDIPATTTLLSDKLSLVTHHHLLTRVPVKIDLDDWNYGYWEYFFEQLCSSYEVTKFLHDESTAATGMSTVAPLTPKEAKVDKIILSWIFTTLSDPLQKRLVVARPTTAKAAWTLLTDIVKDNKRSCTSALKAELRSIKLGTLSMEAYFQKIDSLVTILTSLGSLVNEEYVVHHAVEGLPEKYNQVCGYMHYQDTFPNLKTTRSLLIAEEMRLKSKELTLPVDSSSPMVRMAQSGTTRCPSNPQVKSWKPCFNFAKGSCRFGSDCRYVYDHNAKPIANTHTKQSPTNNTETLLVQFLDKLGNTQNSNAPSSSVPVAYSVNTPLGPVNYSA
ncbi:ribonuclease H-like domain-containing protein [Tanacetum coccineum]